MNKNRISIRQNKRNLANALTLYRAISGFPIIFALFFNQLQIAWLLLLFSALSDVFDGYLARSAGGGTEWGSILDPLADKLVLAAPIIWLVGQSNLPIWAIWLIFTREILITGWRSNAPKGAPASLLGKFKTIILFISMLCFLTPIRWCSTEIYNTLQSFGLYFFWIGLITAYLSAISYIRSISITHQN